jgi:putative transposase
VAMTMSKQEIAEQRFELIAPLLEPDIEQAERRARREKILERQRLLGKPISERTLRRYVQLYREKGLKGLEPKGRDDCGMLRGLSRSVLDEAKILKAELPQRSVRQIIEILEVEGKIEPGSVSAATLGRHLRKEGLMELPKAPKGGFRRFQKKYRNQLWQVDLKYGPFIPDPGDPKKSRRTYLIAFIDDYTRLVPHAQFYLDQKLPVLEDCFKKAILKRGIPDTVYVDNGKIFVSRWFRIACARLNIRHVNTKPYSPQAKGKIERFLGTVDQFVAEVKLLNPKTLEELNAAFACWLEESYNHKEHSSLGETPAARFAGDTRPLRFSSAEELREAFLWEDDRKVDATGCIKYRNKLYDVGPDLAGKTVEIRFDPFAPETVEIWVNGRKDRDARELVKNKDRFAPETPEPAKTDRSRYLEILTERAKARRKKRLGAISFRGLEEDGDV